jgi:predicted membrane protein
VLTGTSHCGAGCVLGDIVVEWAAFAIPAFAVWFGYGTLFGERTFAIWIPDFIAAFLIGIAFQYFAIQAMQDLSVTRGLSKRSRRMSSR